jgi:hypothetical protein
MRKSKKLPLQPWLPRFGNERGKRPFGGSVLPRVYGLKSSNKCIMGQLDMKKNSRAPIAHNVFGHCGYCHTVL